MNLDLSLRVAGISPSATLSVDARVKALKAEGRDVIGFGAGEPDFATPEHVVEAAVQACRDPRNHRYSPTGGLPELREAISAKTVRDSGLHIDPLDVLVTNGGKHAVEQAFATLLNPGDEVLLPAPYWTTYPEAIRLAGGTPVMVATDADSGFKVDPGQLEAHRTEKTKLLVLCSPSNPTGSVYSAEELAAIGAWLVSVGIWVLADEIYEHFVYKGDVAPSLPVVSPEVRGQCVIVNGVAKSYAMTGWRVGWVVAPRAVIAAATNLQSHTTSNVSNVPQHAAIAALSGPLDGVHEMREAFRRRRQLTVEMLRDVAGFTCAMPDGAFYAFPSVAGLIGRNLHGSTVQSSIDVAGLMLDTCGVAAVPGEAFGAPGYLRFSYALSDDEIVNGLSRLAQEFGNSAT